MIIYRYDIDIYPIYIRYISNILRQIIERKVFMSKTKSKLINIPTVIFEKIEKYQKENGMPYFTTALFEIIRIGLREIEQTNTTK